MTIRKKILLFSAVALGAFLAAVYIVSRFALLSGFARLETDSAHDNIQHLQSAVQNEQDHLEILARDYAQWDDTYTFMQTADPQYALRQLSRDSFKVMRVDFFALLNPSGQVVLNLDLGDPSLSAAVLDNLTFLRDRDQKLGLQSSAKGILKENGRLLLLSLEPIVPSRGSGKSRGTVVMGRLLDEIAMASLSQSAGFPVWLEPAENGAPLNASGVVWSDGRNSARTESDSTMLNYVALQGFSGKTVALLVGRTRRSLYLEGKAEIRILWGLLMLAGAVFCGALFFFVDAVLMGRVAGLSSEVAKVTVSGDLSLRLDPGGNDELSTLARAINTMLAAIQKTKAELLQAQESLRFHAEHDALTGILNRRAIRDVLRKELARCRRENTTLGVILADVDHFKKINDHYGHAAGDAVLVTAVQRISSTLRSYDSVGRYGGEEFLIVAPGCELDVAKKLAERIRGAIGDEPVDLGAEAAKISISLGVTLGTADSDPEFLVTLADSAMYQAKRNGRNRVEVGLELPLEESVEVDSR